MVNNAHEEVQRIIETEQRLKTYTGEDEVILSHDALDILHERMNETHDVEMRSGFPSLDAQIRHFLGGELVVISGPTKHGKTLLAQTFTRNFCAEHKVPLWFTYEVPAYQFLRQFGDQLPAFVMPKNLKDNSLTWIIERVHEAKLKFNIDAVFIDNTHNVLNLTTHNLSQVMGELLKALKKMAQTFNVAVFLLHHITKVKLEDGEQLGSHLLRDSSMVSQTADTVMFVWRNTDTVLYPNQGFLRVTENRRYGVMNWTMNTVKVGNFLEEAAHQDG